MFRLSGCSSDARCHRDTAVRGTAHSEAELELTFLWRSVDGQPKPRVSRMILSTNRQFHLGVPQPRRVQRVDEEMHRPPVRSTSGAPRASRESVIKLPVAVSGAPSKQIWRYSSCRLSTPFDIECASLIEATKGCTKRSGTRKLSNWFYLFHSFLGHLSLLVSLCD